MKKEVQSQTPTSFGKYLVPTDKHWACDIEGDDLLDNATRIWCSCVENVVTGEKHTFLNANEFNAWHEQNPDAIFVGHNFIGYDMVMKNRHWKARIGISKVVDTFVLSMLYNPNMPAPADLNPPGTPKDKRKGPHSLEAWGMRLKFPKTGHTDFSQLTDEMITYCQNDVSLTALLYRKLAARMLAVGFTDMGCEVEHLSWNIIQNKQRRHGFPFNYRKAHELYVSLRAREEELKNEIYKLWPPVFQPVREFAKARKKSGEYSKQYLEHLGQYPKLVERPDGGYTAWDYVEFNLGSPIQRVEKLLELGWTPSRTTKTGQPQVDEDALLEFAETSGTPELKALATWVVCSSRANMIGNWLDSYNQKTGCIHGKLFIASTLRYKHSSPNSANIPAVRLKKNDKGGEDIQYGEDGGWSYEARDLFWAGESDEWCLVGIDGSGIQNRNLIHHLIGTVGEEAVRDFKELALAGDIHKRNIEVLGLANKAAAKKFYYTLMMGGQGARLAADQAQFGTKLTAKQGTELRKMMIDSIPGFGQLIEKLQAQLDKTGRIILCDGTPILVPSPHMVIPYLLQGDESRIMKKASILVDTEIRRNRLTNDVFKVADIHDEWQFKVRRSLAQDFVNMALPCFPRAGEFFDYNIRIDGDAKIGNTWAETH